jgi:exodeoxyribonuclease-3
MKLISWNVNGIRAALKKGLPEFISTEAPDIVCFQETKATAEDVALPPELAEYFAFWNSAEKKGYAGTAIFSRTQPLSVTFGIGTVQHDREGRVITAEYEDFFLINVYVPNSQRELARLPYRQQWDIDFCAYLQRLGNTKPVICCGDLNVAHTALDLARPKENTKTHGFTPEERSGFDALLQIGLIDSFREFESAGGHYSWWSHMGGARARNIGWRIDYFLCSSVLRPRIASAEILPLITGSDHCPITLQIQ